MQHMAAPLASTPCLRSAPSALVIYLLSCPPRPAAPPPLPPLPPPSVEQVLSFGPKWLEGISRSTRISFGYLTGWLGLPVPKPLPVFMVRAVPRCAVPCCAHARRAGACSCLPVQAIPVCTRACGPVWAYMLRARARGAWCGVAQPGALGSLAHACAGGRVDVSMDHVAWGMCVQHKHVRLVAKCHGARGMRHVRAAHAPGRQVPASACAPGHTLCAGLPPCAGRPIPPHPQPPPPTRLVPKHIYARG